MNLEDICQVKQASHKAGTGSYWLMGQRLSLGRWKVLQMNSGDDYTTMQIILNATIRQLKR